MAKKIKFLVNEAQAGNYVRAFRERRDIVVQVWWGKTSPDGEPEGDWSMPGVLGLTTAIAQAVLQTKTDVESKRT